MILRKSFFLKTFSQKDYHSVPKLIAKRKENAQYFLGKWRMNVGRAELILTHTREGRKKLLHARLNSLATELDQHIETVSKWK